MWREWIEWLVGIDPGYASVFAVAFSINTFGTIVRRQKIHVDATMRERLYVISSEVSASLLSMLDEKRKRGAPDGAILKVNAKIAGLSKFIVTHYPTRKSTDKRAIIKWCEGCKTVMLLAAIASVVALLFSDVQYRLFGVILLLPLPISVVGIYVAAFFVCGVARVRLCLCKRAVCSIRCGVQERPEEYIQKLQDILRDEESSGT